MSAPPFSIVIVSRHRTAELLRCLAGVAQLDHPAVEVVVVADPAGAAAVRAAGHGGALKLAEYDDANISAARNIGLGLASAEVVGFLDDDAAPEPTWASRIAAPFADPRVAAAGGFVRGRNGISFQWRASEVDALGQDHPLAAEAAVRPGTAARAVKTQGACCAFRRAALAKIGGFDPALRFFLDEADVNLRLAGAGHLTAIVPDAQVHHGFAASARRRADRAPRDLREIGASLAVFLRRHAPPEARPARIEAFRDEQRRRLLRHMVAGRLGPEEVGPLLAGLEAGLREGETRSLPARLPLPAPALPFTPFPGTGPRPGAVLAGLSRAAPRLEARAKALRDEGRIVTLLRFGPGARAHHMRFRPDGIWEQRGGLFGRSDREGPPVRLRSPRARAAEETVRIAPFRPTAPPEYP